MLFRDRNMTDVIIVLYPIVRTTLVTKEFPPYLVQCRLVCRRYRSKEVIVQLLIVSKRICQGVQRLNIFLLAAIMFWYDINYILVDGGGYLVFGSNKVFFSNIKYSNRWKKEVWASIAIQPYHNVEVVEDDCHRHQEILLRWILVLLEQLSWLPNEHLIHLRLLI